MTSTIEVSTYTTFLGINPSTISKMVLLPKVSEHPGRVLRIKDISGVTKYQNALLISTQQGDLLDGRLSTLTFSSLGVFNQFYGTSFPGVKLISDGLSNWTIQNLYTNSLISTQRFIPTDISGIVQWFDAGSISASNGAQIPTIFNKCIQSSVISTFGVAASTGQFTSTVITGGLSYNFYANTSLIPDSNGPPGTNWGGLLLGPVQCNVHRFGNNYGINIGGQANYQLTASGSVYSPDGGTIQFRMTTDDGMLVNFNNSYVLVQWQQQGATTYTSASLTLPAGYTPIFTRWYDSGGGGAAFLEYSINGGVYESNASTVMVVGASASAFQEFFTTRFTETFQSSANNLGPLFQVSSLNGNNTLLFNNSNFNMTLTPTRTYDAITFFAVSRLTNVTNQRFWAGTYGNQIYGYHGAKKNVGYMDNWFAESLPNSNDTTVNSNWDLLSIVRDPLGSSELFNFGGSRGRGPTTFGMQGLTINNSGVSPTEKSTGEFAEFIIYNRNLTASERQYVEGYLARKYGFTNNLVLGHAYSTQIPSTVQTISSLATIPNLRLWFDASQLSSQVTIGTQYIISSMSNFTGTGELFGSNSATSTTWATLNVSTLNNRNTLGFSTTQAFILNRQLRYPVFTLFSLTRHTAQPNQTNRLVLQGQTETTYYGYNFSGRKNIFTNTGGSIEATGVPTDSNWNLYRFQRDSNARATLFSYSSNINTNTTQVGFEGLAINTGADITNTSHCEIAEIALYDRALRPDEAWAVETYLAEKWGLQNFLQPPNPNAPVFIQSTPTDTISTISNLKLWYDATKLSLLNHPYKFNPENINPSSISSLDCWFDASLSTNFGLSTQFVSTWTDSFSNARNLIQAAGASQPLYDFSTNAVYFNNSRFLTFISLPNIINKPHTIFLVEKRQAAVTYMFGGSNTTTYGNLYYGYGTATQMYHDLYGLNVANNIENYNARYYGSNEPWRIHALYHDGQQRRTYINGHYYAAQNTQQFLTSWVNAGLGRYNANFYTGYVREFIFYNRALSDDERQKVEGYLANKWGIQDSLWSNTPVSTMANATGLGADWINTNSLTYRPTVYSNALLKQNVVNFKLVFDRVFNPAYLTMASNRIYATEFTLFTLARQAGPGVFSNFSLFQYPLSFQLFGYSNGVKNIWNNDGDIDRVGTASDGLWDLYVFQRDKSGMALFSRWGSNINRYYSQTGFEGIQVNLGWSSNLASDGEVAEVMLYDRCLQSNEIVQVQDYLANKFNLTSSFISTTTIGPLFVTQVPQLQGSTNGALASISSLKYWFDPNSLSYLSHPYGSTKISVNPSSFSSLQCWYDSSGVSNFQLSSSTRVTRWNDIGFYGRHLVSPTLANQPLLDLSGQGVVFDGNVRFLTFLTIPSILNSDYTIYIVEQRQTTGTSYFLGGTATVANQNLYLGYGNQNIVYFDGYGTNIAGGVDNYLYRNAGSNEPWRIWCFRYGENTKSIFMNGQRLAHNIGTNFGSNIYDLQAWTGAALGRFITTYMNGKVRELMIFNGYMNEIDRQQIEGSLAWKWGLNSTLMNYTPVSTFSNLVGIGGNLINTGDLRFCPSLSTSTELGGAKILRFLNNQTLIQDSQRLYPNEFTMFYLARYLTGVPNLNRSILQGAGFSGTYYGFFNGNRNHYLVDGQPISNVVQTPNSNWDLYTFRHDKVGQTRAAIYGSNINTVFTQTGFEGLAINIGNDSNQSSDCEVGEVLMYDRALSIEECTNVEDYLVKKYNLQNYTLPFISSMPSAPNFQPTPPYARLVTPSTISSLEDIAGLKIWFDPTQVSLMTPHSFLNSTMQNLDPSSIGSSNFLEGWYDASGISNFSTNSTNFVAAWYDRSSRGRHIFQPTFANQPFYISSTQDVAFNNAQFLAFSNIPPFVNNEYTIFIAEQRRSAASWIFGGTAAGTNTNLFYGRTNLGSNHYIGNGGNDASYDVDTIYDSRSNGSNEPYRIHTIQFGGGFRKLFLDGQNIATQGFNTDLASWVGAALGRYLTSYYTGNMKEWILYSRNLPDDEREQIEGYLKQKWNPLISLRRTTYVSTVQNLTGLGGDLVRFAPNRYMPALISSPQLNNQYVLRFDTVKYMTMQSNLIYPNFSMFLVYRHLGGVSNTKTIFQGTQTSAFYGPGYGVDFFWSGRNANFRKSTWRNWNDGDGANNWGVAAPDSNVVITTFVRDSNGIGRAAHFGSNGNSGYSQTGFDGLGVNFGAIDTGATYSNSWSSDCEVGDIIVYDRALSSNECQRVEAYLARKYNQVGNLLAPHPLAPTLQLSTISSLSSISSLKLWFDPSQMSLYQHPYKTSGYSTSPSTISSLDCWYDASGISNFSSLSTSYVARWNDLGPNGRHLQQPTVANRPFYNSTTSEVQFTGAAQHHLLWNLTIPFVINTDYSVFVVEKRQTSAVGYMIGGTQYAANTSNTLMTLGYNANASAYVDTAYLGQSAAIDTYNPRNNGSNEPYRIWSVVFNGSAQVPIRQLWINGEYLSGYSYGAYLNYNHYINSWPGAGVGRTWSSQFYTGNMREIIFYNRALSDDERQRIEGYLANKWNIQSSLSPVTYASTVKNLTGVPYDWKTYGWLPTSPILSTSAILNNQNILRFTTSRYLTTSNNDPYNTQSNYLVYPGQFTLFALVRHLSLPTTTQRSILQGLITQNHYGYYNGRKNVLYMDGNVEATGVPTDSNWNLIRVTRDSVGLNTLYSFGQVINSGFTQTGFDGLAVNVGADSNQSSDCEVGEVLFYDRQLASGESSDVENYLTKKWGIVQNFQNAQLPFATQLPLYQSTISSLSTISNLKYWFDPTQVPVLDHPYKFSTTGSFNPSSISSLDAWYDASGAENFALSGSNIALWSDKSGKERHLLQATALNQPFWSTGTREVVFDGASRFLTFTSVGITNTDFSIFILEKRQTAITYILGGTATTVTNGNLHMGYRATATATLDYWGNGVDTTIDAFTTPLSEPYRIWSITYGGSSIQGGAIGQRKICLDGMIYITQNTSQDVVSWAGASVGRFLTSYYTGRICEIIIYNRSLRDDERQQVEGYLANKWKVTDTLTPFTPISTLRNLTWLGSDFIASNSQLKSMPYLSTNSTLNTTVVRLQTAPYLQSMYLSPIRIYPTEYTMFTLSRHTSNNLRNIFQGGLLPGLYGYGPSPYTTGYRKNIFSNDNGFIEVTGTPVNVQWDFNVFQKNSNGIGSYRYFGSNMNMAYLQSGLEGLTINTGTPDCNATSDCEIGEIQIYDRALKPDEIRQIEQYYVSKYNLSNQYQFYTQAYQYSTISTLATISSLQVWYDATQVNATSNYTPISSMQNLVNNGLELFSNTTGVLANYPRWVSSVQVGLPVITLSTTQSLVMTPARVYSEFSFFNVSRHTQVGNQRRIWQGTTGDYLYGYHGGYKLRYYGEQWQLQPTEFTTNSKWDINCYIRTTNGILSTITFNGAFYQASTSTSFLGLENIAINSNTTETSDCQFGEMMIYNRALTWPTEVQEVEGYLAEKWGLNGVLPPNHPYYYPTPTAYSLQPPNISSLSFWYDTSDLSTLTYSNTVAQVYDKTGTVADINQRTESAQPLFESKIARITFSNQHYLEAYNVESLVSNTSFTIVMLERRLSSIQDNYIFGGDSTNPNENLVIGYKDTSTFTFSFNDNLETSISSYTQNEAPSIWRLNYDQAQREIYRNGTLLGSIASSSDLTSYSNATLGYNFATRSFYTGNFIEALMFKPSISPELQQVAEGYLSWKYSLQTLLPSSHPYKTQEPYLPGTFSPSQISALTFWFDASTTPASNTSTINSWFSMVNPLSNFIMSNVGASSTYPTISTNSLNGLNTLNFTTAQKMTMYPTGYTTNAPYTFIFLARQTGPTYARFITSPTNNYLWGHWNGQKNVLHLDSWITASSGPAANTDWDLYMFQNTGGTVVMRNFATTVATPTVNSQGMRGLGINVFGTEFSQGEIAEILYFNTNIGSNAFQQVEGYLSWKWGLQSRLPSNHPYKNAPP